MLCQMRYRWLPNIDLNFYDAIIYYILYAPLNKINQSWSRVSDTSTLRNCI
jgi:hypothetical protein